VRGPRRDADRRRARAVARPCGRAGQGRRGRMDSAAAARDRRRHRDARAPAAGEHPLMAPANTATAPAEPKHMSTEQGLEKTSARTPAVITTPDEFFAARQRWQEQHYNVLTPFTNISGLAAQHGIITSVIQVNADKTVGEVYDGLPFLAGNEVALAKIG